MLPKIICSSVIRAANRGDSHGGLYIVNLESGEYRQVLDWDRPDIDWDGRGGDRGIRGMAFYKGLLYAAAGDEIFVFNKEMKVVKSFRNRFLKHTHEVWRDGNKLYIIANMFDAVLVLDLDNDRWIDSYHFQNCTNKAMRFNTYDSANCPEPLDKLHLDSVLVMANTLLYCGHHMETLNAIDLETDDILIYQDKIKNSHNARPYLGGVIHNLAFQHKTVYRNIFGKIVEEWITPLYKKEDMTHTDLPHDHAVQGYVRGMVLIPPFIVVGSSPATINVFTHGRSEPVKSIQISNDIRNSICGISICEW